MAFAWDKGRRAAALGAWLACWICSGPANAQPAELRTSPPPAEDFVRPAQVSDVSVSPSGQRVAMLLMAPSGRRVAAVMDLANPGQHKVVGAFSDADVDSVDWVNDDRLVYSAAQPSYLVEAWGAGIFAVDHDGGRPRQLVAWANDTSRSNTQIASRVLPYGWFLYGFLDDGSEDVLMYRLGRDTQGNRFGGQLARVHTVNATTRDMAVGAPPFASRWLLDGKDQLRVVRSVRDGRDRLHWRAPGSEEWVVVEDREAGGPDALVPRHLESDDELIVETRAGRDTLGLYVYRLKERRLEPEPLAALNGFDMHASLQGNPVTRRLQGVHIRGAAPQSLWFDEPLAAAQHAVDQALPPGRSNRLYCGSCVNARHYVVLSRSDRNSGELHHYDVARKSLRRLGTARPWLPEASQGQRSFHRVPARDGLVLPVVVTHPPGSTPATPAPAVVLVHGGPWIRGGDLSWDAQAQFLASRGWRVLQVEFRGSAGFGWRHFRAGWKQWGLAMQDDLADAVAWAAREKLVDPAKVCIVGESYGGYAALMGPIRHPGVYRCAASYAGVTDIGLIYSAKWGDLSEQGRRWGLPQLVGDPERDAEALRAVSPLQRVAEIKVPVLLGQGVHDRRVPKEHADRFVSAARAAGVAVQLVEFEEGHSWVEPRHQAEWLRRLEAHIAQAFRAEPAR